MSKIKMLNKTMTTILITLLTLPILLAVIPRASASILVTSCTPNYGPVGTTVTIVGTGASAGGAIYVYWDNLGGAVLNSTAYANGAGAYSVMATIPTAVGGVHSLIVKDVSTGGTIGTYFTITSTLTLTPTSGIPTDSITVDGAGFAASSNVSIFINSNASRLLNSTTGASATYESAVPILGANSAFLSSDGGVATTYAYARIYPTSTLTLGTLDTDGKIPTFKYWFNASSAHGLSPALELQFKNASGPGVVEVTVFGEQAAPTAWSHAPDSLLTTLQDLDNYAVAYGTKSDGVTPIDIHTGSNSLTSVKAAIHTADAGSDSWTLTRVAAQVGWNVIAQACYVDNFVVGTDTYNVEPPVITTNSTALGVIASSFTVPSALSTPNSYPVSAADDMDNNAIAAFSVGPAITLTPTTGPAGTVVTITGRGYDAGAEDVNITIGGTTAPLNATIHKTASSGNFTGQFIVPTHAIGQNLDVKANTTVHDEHAHATFNVTGNTGITLTPTTGAVGTVVTIAGVNFTAIAGKTVRVDFGTILGWTTFSTNATGGFSGTFTVPSLLATSYTVTANDTNGLNANTPFVIAVTFLGITPVKCPTGTQATVTSYGFTTSGGTANVTIGTLRVLTNILDSVLQGGTTFYVPTLPVGNYTVTALDTGLLTASTNYEVNATTTVTLNSSSAIVGAHVALNASYFKATQALTFTFKNATYTVALAVPAATGSGYSDQMTALGLYNGTFAVPSLAIGSYTINATDAHNCTVEVSFGIVLAVPTITLSPTESLIGAVVRVTGTTFTASTAVNIYFGSTLVRTVNSTSGGALEPSDANFTVPDVSYGTYTVTASDGVNSATATFNVLGVHGIDTLQTMVAAIEAKLDQYGSFWNFTNTWFTTISNKLGVFTGADTVASLLYSIKTSVSTINWADVTAIKAKTDTINWADITTIKSTTSLSIDYLWGLQDHPLWGLRTKVVPMLESIKNATQFTAGTYSTTIPTSVVPVSLGKSSKITLTVRTADDTTEGFVIKAYIYDGTAWRPLTFSAPGIASADCAATVEFTTGADGRFYFETTGATFTAFIYSAEFSP
jgi:hypothetical protein